MRRNVPVATMTVVFTHALLFIYVSISFKHREDRWILRSPTCSFIPLGVWFEGGVNCLLLATSMDFDESSKHLLDVIR